MQPAPEIYKRLIGQLEARREALGWSCEKLDEVSGLQRGYWAKMLHPDAPSGRCGGWQMLDYVAQALWPDGQFKLIVLPDEGDDPGRAAQQQRGKFA